ncbi:MAG: TlpA family protein disulfide reductase [Acidobacteria bacterium]|nr:TlpA family protein disulfide reductase [Acidobacteriota bacterium]
MKLLLTKLGFTASILAVCVALVCGQPAKKPSVKQATGPSVKQIDLEGLKALLKPSDKPRLINFWATWCDPCREEFPELVKTDASYKGKIDFLTVSLDDVEDIGTVVPKFLTEMKATMPAYLLKVADEDAAIAAISGISSDFHGSLPFTILLKPNGEIAYAHAGKIHPEELNTEITKQISSAR